MGALNIVPLDDRPGSEVAGGPRSGPDWSRVRAAARALWSALPGDLLGWTTVRLAGAGARRRVAVDRPDGWSAGEATVVEDARLRPVLRALPLRPVAVTFGRWVLAADPLSEATLRHELEHVRQWARLGPLFLPLYLADSLRLVLAGADRYAGNRFEIAARAKESAADARRPLPPRSASRSTTPPAPER